MKLGKAPDNILIRAEWVVQSVWRNRYLLINFVASILFLRLIAPVSLYKKKQSKICFSTVLFILFFVLQPPEFTFVENLPPPTDR